MSAFAGRPRARAARPSLQAGPARPMARSASVTPAMPPSVFDSAGPALLLNPLPPQTAAENVREREDEQPTSDPVRPQIQRVLGNLALSSAQAAIRERQPVALRL